MPASYNDVIHGIKRDLHIRHYSIVSCFKLVRVLKLEQLISHINISESFKIQLLLFKMVLFLFIYMHFTCCLWYFLSELSGFHWVPLQLDVSDFD
jgi:hypothetical protein